MIHNGLGCMVGAVLVDWVIGFLSKPNTNNKIDTKCAE
jgi:hypothetical protein